jgi:ligand-binding sensor domain-containing protein
LSKFDGYHFTNYGKERGLPHPQVNDLIECSDGTYWVATNGGGVASFNPAARVPANQTSRFKVYSLGYDPTSNIVNCLCEDREGRIWAGTDKGLFYYDKTQDRFTAAIPDPIEIYSLFADGQGVLWIGVGNQLWRRNTESQLTRYSFQVSKDPGRIFSLRGGNNGKLWAGTWFAGLFELEPKLLPPQDSALSVRNGPFSHHTTADGAVIGTIQDLHQSLDGHLWIAAARDYSTSLGGGLFKLFGSRQRRQSLAWGWWWSDENNRQWIHCLWRA